VGTEQYVDSVVWDFGDSTFANVSDFSNQTHTYETADTFTVTLRIFSRFGWSRERKTGFIQALGPLAPFLFPDTICVGTEAEFTANSECPIDTSYWDFGDGSDDSVSVDESPSHVFDSAGTFNVYHWVGNPHGKDSTYQSVTVAAPSAEFTVDAASDSVGCAPHEVTFVNRSDCPIAEWRWDFGDGATFTGTDTTVTHTYDTAGLYDVTLVVAASTGYTDSLTKEAFIQSRGPVPMFTFTDSLCADQDTVEFLNVSECGEAPGTTWLWDFGDGATSTERDAEHSYTARGPYVVSLTASNQYGDSTFVDTLTAVEEPVVVITVPTTVALGTEVTISAELSADGVEYFWHIVDVPPADYVGKVITHTWQSPGLNQVSLTIINSCGEATGDVEVTVTE